MLNSMAVLGAVLGRADIIVKLKAYIAVFTAVNQTKDAYSAARAARKAVLKKIHAFYNGVVSNLKKRKAHMGLFVISTSHRTQLHTASGVVSASSDAHLDDSGSLRAQMVAA